jgi:hypothetical protein
MAPSVLRNLVRPVVMAAMASIALVSTADAGSRPNTTISSGPDQTTTETSAEFEFSSTKDGSTFKCRLDNRAWENCDSPKSYDELEPGSHTFYVKATYRDRRERDPATWKWTVTETDPTPDPEPPPAPTPPDTTIAAGPSGTVTDTTATFAFTSDQSSATFECSRDGSSFAACTSPVSYTGLTSGPHTFEVRARDTAGNVDPTPAGRSWTVDAPLSLPPSTLPGGANLQSPGFRILSDSEAASHVRRSTWEPRPGNYDANRRVPSSDELSRFQAESDKYSFWPSDYKDRITGNFTGTTDEIIQWAAWKWGLDEDILRAQAHRESNWYENGPAGDGGVSYGLMQVKSTVHLATYPLSSQSTAFNIDYAAAKMRFFFDGHCTWMNTQPGNVGTYTAGDIWGTLGAYYSGGWHNPAAEWYIGEVKNRLAKRVWKQPGF